MKLKVKIEDIPFGSNIQNVKVPDILRKRVATGLDYFDDALGGKGFTPSMGARPMARLINEKIKKPLSKQILFGEDVDLVKLSIQDDKIDIRTDKIQT